MKVEINEVEAKLLYPLASDSIKKELENKFGKDFFMPKDYEKIVSYEAAVEKRPVDDDDIIYETDAPHIVAFKELDGFVHYSPNLFYTKEQLKDGYPYVSTAQYSFMTLWMSINGKDSYHINPAVFVYSFEVLSTNGKPINI